MKRFFLLSSLTASLLALFFSSCGDNFRDREDLDVLRVLALKADLPETYVTTGVTITPLISDVDNGGRQLYYTVESCYDLGVNLGGTPTCKGNSTRIIHTLNQPFSLSPPNYTGEAPSFTVEMPSALIFYGVSSDQQFNGVAYLIIYEVTNENDNRSVQAFRRIILSTKTTLNQNPGTPTISIESESDTVAPRTASTLTAEISGTGAESYFFRNSFGETETKNEELLTSWYISHGGLRRIRSFDGEENTYYPDSSPTASGNITFVAVTRDGRGGSSHSVLTVQEP